MAALAAACDSGDSAPRDGPPQDLVPFARLVTTDTRPNAFFPWPRESEDAIATVRDSHASTSWKPAVGAARAEIDLLPWLDRPVRLHELRLEHGAAAPDAVEVALGAACGAEPALTLPWPDPSRPLELGGARAGCVALTLTTSEPVDITALSLISRDATVALPGFTADQVQRAATVFTDSGVIEGFYGVPWSWDERRAMLRAMAEQGLDRYLYAPKHDPLHRDRWRDPYSEEDLQHFADLATLAGALDIELIFGISPLIDFDFDDDADYQTLLAKVLRFTSVGVQGVALLADDIEFEVDTTVDGALGQKHAALANRLLDDLRAEAPGCALWYVPTVYSDARREDWEGGEGYLQALGALHQDIAVLWTGTGTASATMSAADMQAVTAAVGRPPLIWDNFWANDGGDGFTGRVLLAPFSGRTADLPAAVQGIAHNPMIQGALSRLMLGSFTHYLQNPGPTDAAAARRAAAERMAAREADRELLDFVMRLFDGHATRTGGFTEMEQAIAELRAAIDGGELPASEAATLLDLFARMSVLESETHHSALPADLVDELVYPLRKAGHDGECGLWTLALLGERLAGRDGGAELRLAEAAMDRSSLSRFIFSAGEVSGLLEQVGTATPGDRGFAAPAEGDAVPASCQADAALRWTPFAAGVDTAVFGLPGATVSAGTLSWTPAHGGRYRAVARGRTDAGWAFRQIEITCVP